MHRTGIKDCVNKQKELVKGTHNDSNNFVILCNTRVEFKTCRLHITHGKIKVSGRHLKEKYKWDKSVGFWLLSR